MSACAPLAEVFISFQGEGPLAGVRQAFVRVRGCDLTCRYCDTPAARDTAGPCRMTLPVAADGAPTSRSLDNPFTASRVFNELAPLPPGLHSVALTGGEPLLYPDFAADMAAEARRYGTGLYLETGGHRPEALASLAPELAFISLDFKLPSTLAEPVRPERFVESYRVALGRPLAVKMVVTAGVTEDEVGAACRALASVSPAGPVILQPVTPRGGLTPPGAHLLTRLYEAAARHMDQVRVIPQCHHLLGMP